MEDFRYYYKIIVPNAHFVGNEIINISSHPGFAILMNIRLSLENEPEKIKLALEIIENIITNNNGARFIYIKHDHFDDYSYVLRIHYDILLFKERIKVKSDINIEIARQFHEKNIKLLKQISFRLN
ncbi:MscS Mechanosensitive ion channel [Candidatus Magnetomorum sp. HK-1]|nr:MscS Mechanosensitive ion channel [Candidatus Magnetomorum sp. HK-1]